MRVAVDAMGGDGAPETVVEGALRAGSLYGIHTLLFGPIEKLEPLLEQSGQTTAREFVELRHAPEVIGMDEQVSQAVRSKKDSSLVAAACAVADGESPALVSAGNTGATMAAALFYIRRMRGIHRPAIAIPMPTVEGVCTFLDGGANVDCRPEHLVGFAQMGSAYARSVRGVDSPRVALLNIGEEAGKGNEAAKKAHELLADGSLNFIGNIEGRDILWHKADVVVCDGFVGNILLKFAEGMGEAIFATMKQSLLGSLRGRIGAALVAAPLRRLKKRLDYSEYGGAPLLGVNGVVMIAHGRSNATAVANAIRAAHEAAEAGMVQAIAAGAVR